MQSLNSSKIAAGVVNLRSHITNVQVQWLKLIYDYVKFRFNAENMLNINNWPCVANF